MKRPLTAVQTCMKDQVVFFLRIGEFPDFSPCWAGLNKLPEGMHWMKPISSFL